MFSVILTADEVCRVTRRQVFIRESYSLIDSFAYPQLKSNHLPGNAPVAPHPHDRAPIARGLRAWSVGRWSAQAMSMACAII
jgi:hypothetical protein